MNKQFQAQQGDILLTAGKMPESVTRVDAGALYVVASGESGHAHVIDAPIEVFEDEQGVRWVSCIESFSVKHIVAATGEASGEHATVVLPPGTYRIDPQQEPDDDDLWRPVMD